MARSQPKVAWPIQVYETKRRPQKQIPGACNQSQKGSPQKMVEQVVPLKVLNRSALSGTCVEVFTSKWCNPMETAKPRSKIRLTNFRNSCRLSRRFSWSCLGVFSDEASECGKRLQTPALICKYTSMMFLGPHEGILRNHPQEYQPLSTNARLKKQTTLSSHAFDAPVCNTAYPTSVYNDVAHWSS